jgi:hypothetical protein
VCNDDATMETLRHLFHGLLLVAAMIATVTTARALEPGKDGWYSTGDGIRTKKVAFVSVKVYAISHATKQLPPTKSKQAMIDLDADKRFAWRMLRDVDVDKIQNALREAYALNGYSDGGKIGAMVGAFTHDLKEGTGVTITYDSNAKTTTIHVSGDGSATVPGVDFMKATWSIWFGKIDQPDLGDALIARM